MPDSLNVCLIAARGKNNVIGNEGDLPWRLKDDLTFFKKVTSVRDKLRVLEQKLNAHQSLSLGEKAELQGYITRAYGSLTTFNSLFRDDEDRFKGTGG